MSLKMTMNPGAEGDFITLDWGPATDVRRMLIDLGRTKSYRAMSSALAAMKRFELFVITHIDADHIEGAMPFVKPAVPAFDTAEVWFNGYDHLIAAKARLSHLREPFAPGQGEKLTDGIRKFGWEKRWNAAFGSGPVSVDSPEAAHPIELAGGLTLRLLSPSDRELAALEPTWRKVIENVGLAPGQPDLVEPDVPGRERFGILDVESLARDRFEEDTSTPNGTSIAFLAEFAGKRLLLTGDAHPGRLESSLRLLGASEDNRMKIDCFKVSHHGSKANTSPSLLKIIDCTRFAFSTDGTKHDHPNPQTIARILKADQDRPKQLIFNFRQPNTTIWDNERLKRDYAYTCVFPPDGKEGVAVDCSVTSAT
ncbi:hypothetical protein [Mesorhizobium sp. ES1-6]|uniref:hypothetical protein n=1 Tax=Mesorhizobium sp. ES1-6 TaxID=2876626 RepID=UPI001CC951D8|nr:hypothetical protein [Mesorhizobium sp. ES1-6]MBZ9801089.1 hypothetical protein [Mesorhizobium sp. ES1-6]